MNSSPGLGQPSPGQPDFSGPQGDQSQPDSNLAGWTHSASGQPDDAAPAVRPDATMGDLPAQFGSAPTPGIASPEPGRPTTQGYGQEGYAPQGYDPQGYDQQAPQQFGPSGYPQGYQQQFGQPGQSSLAQPGQQPFGAGGQPTYGPAGQPSYAQPGQPPSGQPYRPGGYPPPVQQPPSGPPVRRGRSARGFILAGAVIGLLIIGLLGWQFLAPQVLGQPSASPSAPPSLAATPTGTPQPTVVRTSESVGPTASSPVTGGGIGRAVDFKTTEGTGKFTVASASWADNGIFEPTDGSAYLIVNITFEGVSGSVTTGPFFTRVTDEDGENHMMTIGAKLERQLGMSTLKAGQQSTGQVAFELPRGPVRFDVLNELLESVASIDIPG